MNMALRKNIVKGGIDFSFLHPVIFFLLERCDLIEKVHTVQEAEPGTLCSVMNRRKIIGKKKKYFLAETNRCLL